MDAALVRRLEIGIDGAASAALATAVAFATSRWVEPWMVQPQLGTFVALAGAATLGLCWMGLSWVDARPQEFPAGMFDLGVLAPSRSKSDLVLADAERIADGHHEGLLGYETLGPDALLSIPTPEHSLPVLSVLALQPDDEPVRFLNEQVLGSISMRSVVIGG